MIVLKFFAISLYVKNNRLNAIKNYQLKRINLIFKIIKVLNVL